MYYELRSLIPLTMTRPQKTFTEQFNSAMSRAYLWERCRELTRVLPLANTSKELSVAFVQICADIFGYAAGGNPGLGWNLTSLVRNPTTSYTQVMIMNVKRSNFYLNTVSLK